MFDCSFALAFSCASTVGTLTKSTAAISKTIALEELETEFSAEYRSRINFFAALSKNNVGVYVANCVATFTSYSSNPHGTHCVRSSTSPFHIRVCMNK